jgi:hypothetical protein
MDQTREQLEQPVEPVVTGDVQRLKSDASASVEELREFVAGLKGRSPQEVLGIMTGNSLIQGTIQATVLCVVVLAAATVGPWFLASEDAATAEAAAADTEAPTDAAEAPAAEADTAVAVTGDTGTGVVDPAGAATAMGIDEVKAADPDANPLDSNLDNLLDALD